MRREHKRRAGARVRAWASIAGTFGLQIGACWSGDGSAGNPNSMSHDQHVLCSTCVLASRRPAIEAQALARAPKRRCALYAPGHARSAMTRPPFSSPRGRPSPTPTPNPNSDSDSEPDSEPEIRSVPEPDSVPGTRSRSEAARRSHCCRRAVRDPLLDRRDVVGGDARGIPVIDAAKGHARSRRAGPFEDLDERALLRLARIDDRDVSAVLGHVRGQSRVELVVHLRLRGFCIVVVAARAEARRLHDDEFECLEGCRDCAAAAGRSAGRAAAPPPDPALLMPPVPPPLTPPVLALMPPDLRR